MSRAVTTKVSPALAKLSKPPNTNSTGLTSCGAVRLRAFWHSGPMCVILPDAFTGLIGTINSTGKVKLSDALLQRSVLMPWSGCEGGKLYQIEPPQLPVLSSSSRSTGSQTAEQLEVGNDRLDVETDRGSITVLLASEQASTFGFVDKSCVIA